VQTRGTGNERPVDALGRVVVPIELRRALGIKAGTMLIFQVSHEQIVITKHVDACRICGSKVDVVKIKGAPVCTTCVKDIKES
jgi:transcriptional pleiotropic regulator of transition state genes